VKITKNKWFRETWEWFKRFFSRSSEESMTRLLNFMCVSSGILIILICAIFEIAGYAHYGLELAILGVLGKGYQDYTNYRRNKTDKEHGDEIHTGEDQPDTP
jgi:hypothetical protein